MKNHWKKPSATVLNEYQKGIIKLVPQGNIPKMLKANEEMLLKLVKGLSKKKLSYWYAKDKWTIPEIIMHLIDCERIFSYRILAISRGDASSLPGFDENEYIKGIDVSKIPFKKLLKEYKAVRKATVCLLHNLTEEMYMKNGVANKTETSVQKLVYFLVGHEVHHIKVIKERYLK